MHGCTCQIYSMMHCPSYRPRPSYSVHALVHNHACKWPDVGVRGSSQRLRTTGVQEEMDDASFTDGTLEQLSAYFVLTNAEKEKNWKVENVPGLTQDGATKAAGVFAKYDANDDYKLEIYEFKKLCDDADFTLNDEEVKAAMGTMDKNGNGSVEFDGAPDQPQLVACVYPKSL